MSPRSLLVARGVLTLVLILVVSIAQAGTLCGVVRDAQTNAPIAGAGVFVRTPGGAYTGFHGGTGVDGAFCIADVPAGTYDLEVMRDDYMLAYLRGVEVTDGAVDVPVVAGRGVALALPAPNPATASSRIRWTLPEPAEVALRIVDARGRLVRGYAGSSPAGVSMLTWDLRDPAGRRVPAGVYHVHFQSSGVRLVRGLIVLP